MLHIIGTKKEAEQLEGMFPKEIFLEVIGIATIIEENYSSDRDVFEDDGGYICIVQSDHDVAELKSQYELDLESITPEYCTKISDDWINILILCNNEYAISVILSTKTTIAERFYDEM